jgi:hypothetical protein
MLSNQIFSPKELNKKLADAILGSSKECETLLKSYDMSEVLQISVGGGLFHNIHDKKEIHTYYQSRRREQNTKTQNVKDVIHFIE